MRIGLKVLIIAAVLIAGGAREGRLHRAELLLRADPLPDDPANARSIVSTSPIHGTEISGLIA